MSENMDFLAMMVENWFDNMLGLKTSSLKPLSWMSGHHASDRARAAVSPFT